MIRLYPCTVDVGLFANALGQERDAPLLERRSELVEIRSVAPKACRVSRVALDLAHEVLDFGRNLPTGATDEGADFVRIEQPPARTRAALAVADVDLARPIPSVHAPKGRHVPVRGGREGHRGAALGPAVPGRECERRVPFCVESTRESGALEVAATMAP